MALTLIVLRGKELLHQREAHGPEPQQRMMRVPDGWLLLSSTPHLLESLKTMVGVISAVHLGREPRWFCSWVAIHSVYFPLIFFKTFSVSARK